MSAYLEVLATGPLTTVQDLGRFGHNAWGVATSGATDRGALRLANRLVGNPEAAAALEVTLGGLRLRAGAAVEIATTGARCPVRVDGAPTGHNAPARVPAGGIIEMDPPTAGLRTYLAVRGGIDVPAVLGSRSTDVLSGLGPAVPTPGDRLPIGAPGRTFAAIEVAPRRDPDAREATLRVLMGPRDDWFTAGSRRRLLSQAWTVTAESNRVAVRLDGRPLERERRDELPTEGMAPGAVQVPPSGRPVLFLADHPVTGGYPVIAVVLSGDLDLAGQLRPGQALRLRAVPPLVQRQPVATPG